MGEQEISRTGAQGELTDAEIDQNVRVMQANEVVNVPRTKTALKNLRRLIRSRYKDLLKRGHGEQVSRTELIQEAVRTRYEAKMATPEKGTTRRQRYGMGKTKS